MHIPGNTRMDDIMAGVRADPGSRLLSLPAELRAHIFSYVFQDVRCRRPIIIWDVVCTSAADWKTSIATALLLTCRTTYDDCIGLLYDATPVDMTIRGDELDEGFSRFHCDLGTIEICGLLPKLRHIELEITYDPSDGDDVERTISRVRKLAQAFESEGKLKTLDLIFFDKGKRSRWQGIGHPKQRDADSIVEAAMGLRCEKVVGVSRNLAARNHMSAEKWAKLRGRVDGDDSAEEQYREIGYDYWEHW